MARMAGEDEVGGRRQHLEAAVTQARGHALARGNGAPAGVVEPGAVFHRGHAAGNRQAIQRVRVEAVLHPHQGLDQIRVAQRIAHAQAGQGARLGQRVHDQQLRELVHQPGGRLGAEVHIGFIDHDHRVAIALQQPAHLGQGQGHAGGCVGVGEDDAAVGPGTQIVVHPDGEVLVQRDLARGDAVEPGVDRVEAVGDVRVQQRRLVAQQGHEDMGQHLVRPVADEHLLGLQAVVAGNGLAQRGGLRVGVEAQRLAGLLGNGLQHPRAGRVRAFVGVELDQPGDLGLLARHIGRELVDDVAPVAAHGFSLISAACACACRPSP